MASVFNKIAVWGATVDEYGSSGYTISGGNTPGFTAGNLIYAQQVNKAFRNATIVPYAIAEMMTGVNVGASFNIGFDVDPANIAAFASSFKTVFNSYIQSAIKVNSASMADAASAFSTARTIQLTGDVTGSVASTGATGWAFATTIGASKVLTNMISDRAVTTAKIADTAITNSKIASAAITQDKVGPSAIGTNQLTDSNVTAAKLATSAVITAKISANAITTAKISNAQVTNAKIATPWLNFINHNTTASVNLGASMVLHNAFGFDSTDPTGTVKFKGAGEGYFYVDPDTEGDQSAFIPNQAMEGNDYVKSLNFPKASIIGTSAFAYCYNLSEFIGPNIEYIGTQAFYQCSSLTTLSFPKLLILNSSVFIVCNNLSYLYIPNCETIGYNNFSYRSSSLAVDLTIDLRNITGNNVVTHAFYASKITSIYVNNLETMKSSMFYNCTNLKYLTTDNSNRLSKCTFVGANVIANTEIESIHLPLISSLTSGAFSNANKLISITLNSNYSIVENYTFFNCRSLSSIPNDSKIISIGSNAFQSCGALYAPIPGASSINVMNLPQCETIGSYAFVTCYNMTHINIPKVVNINYGTFSNCSALASVRLSSCASIGDYAFYNCSNLNAIYQGNGAKNILSGISYIGQAAFARTGLSYLSLSGQVYIDKAAFQSTLLSYIYLGSCSNIRNGAFNQCSQLQSIYLRNGDVCSLYNSTVFAGTKITSSMGSIFISTQTLLNAYKSAPGWAYFSNRMFIG